MDKNEWLKIFRKAEKKDKFDFIVAHCKDKKVLDVGCVGQDKSRDAASWLHGRIKNVAAGLTGVDIETTGIAELKKEGFEIYTPEELAGIGESFDVIVMGDVIEHVNDPGDFLTFYAKFLKPDGQIIVCTPNSFGIRYTLQVLIYGKPSTNGEHTLAFDPYVMLELFQRIQVKPVKFYWLKEYRKGANWKQKFILFLSWMAIGIRKYFNPNFMYILEKK